MTILLSLVICGLTRLSWAAFLLLVILPGVISQPDVLEYKIWFTHMADIGFWLLPRISA